MRIGIDAKWFFNGNPSGRIVVTNLLKALVEENKHDIVVVLNWSDRKKIFPYKSARVVVIYQKVLFNQLANILSPFVLKKYNLDVCVYQYFSPLTSKYKRVVYIHDVIFETNPEYFSFFERLYFKSIKLLAKRADCIVTISNYEKERILRLGYNKKGGDVKVVYNGVGENFRPSCEQDQNLLAEIKKKYFLPDKFLLYVGRLNERKNIPNLVKAFSQCNFSDVPLILIGRYDWKMLDLGKLIDEMGMKDKVRLLGYISDEELPGIISLSSVFCYISYDEGFGLPPLEAMACGIPVLLSNAGALPEICSSAGNYVDPNNVSEIANAMVALLKIDEGVTEKKIRGIQIARNLTWKRSAMKLLEVLESL